MRKLFCCLGLLMSITASAGELPTMKMSLEIKQAGVREILENILAHSGLRYEIDPAISNLSTVSLKAKDMKWNDVFKNIIKQSNLKYSFDKADKLHITKM